MAELRFDAPSTLAEALRLMAAQAPDAPVHPLSGGSDLIVQMRSGRLRSALVVDLKRIPELTGIRREGGGWLIGAATPCAVIGEHAALRADWPGVVEAACLIGSPQVQGRASLGGNLCNASPAADSVPALIAAGATAIIVGTGSGGAPQRREIPVEALPQGPGRIALAPGELLESIRLPAPAERSADAYLRLIPRSEMDIAVVGCGVCLVLDAAGRIAGARVALGAVAPTALLAPAAAEAIVGSTLDEVACRRLEEAVRAACRPIDDKRGPAAYRTRVAGVLARRAALRAFERAGAAGPRTPEENQS
ncbi:FAD binding domain-containing protein [Quisquiliibacterium transsilvanicum]|uniref:Carbon-monoxide dehydrogenase medium subunit n=1 Tax=Quisquiliibacterium transsilvanicum TaxID=1549638 RepID=A0A7W8MA13_9BURK|nr:xanthine dehydrogenase family protein subunit M [Quisquiliibacterium transsilvanicum]MBB5272920.1 carbon-monoxide dehydrogenase medium subunit [Quisquiliibacterium transsilvanicum]